jgi:hypothetical protein
LYKHASEVLDIPESSLRIYKHQSERFELFRRLNNLSYAHHTEVAFVKKTVEAESRLGELLENTSKVPLREPSKGKDSLKGSKPSLPSGLDKKQSHYAQEIILSLRSKEYFYNPH